MSSSISAFLKYSAISLSAWYSNLKRYAGLAANCFGSRLDLSLYFRRAGDGASSYRRLFKASNVHLTRFHFRIPNGRYRVVKEGITLLECSEVVVGNEGVDLDFSSLGSCGQRNFLSSRYLA
mmetsp:Transcript_273/g.506  ORF Transcript_273/g.506 Transcript_273/m.506 type:complete len:122 (+) Transcript_273:181-546(+)